MSISLHNSTTGTSHAAIVKLGAIRKACGKDVELGTLSCPSILNICSLISEFGPRLPVFLDAPHILTPADIANSFNSPAEMGAAEQNDVDPALLPRGWWKADPERKRSDGIEASITLLRDVLHKDHYEGVFGFR